MGRLLVILKPEVFDRSLVTENIPNIFCVGTELPSGRELIEELLDDMTLDHLGPYPMIWKKEKIRELYNQPHHLIPESGYTISRQATLIENYSGKYAEFYIIDSSNSDTPEILQRKKKEIRKRYLVNPNVAFYSLYHISDSYSDGEREIAIYHQCITH